MQHKDTAFQSTADGVGLMGFHIEDHQLNLPWEQDRFITQVWGLIPSG